MGQNGFVNVVNLRDDLYSSIVQLPSAFRLPDKLGEILSSTYLLGVLKAIVDIQTFHTFGRLKSHGQLKSYGLLIIRNCGSIAVEVVLGKEKLPTVNILWISSDFIKLGQELLFLIKKIAQ